MKEVIKSATTLLNILAFANAGNLREFESLMNAIDRPAEPIRADNKAKATLGAARYNCEPAL
jgi:hypothetical protein